MKTHKNNPGLTLDEIMQRQLITRIKLELTREQIRTYYSAALNTQVSADVPRVSGTIGRVVQWAQYATLASRAYRRIASMFKRRS